MLINKEEISRLATEGKVKDLEGLKAILRDLTKQVIETLMDSEITSHLGYTKHTQNGNTDGNARNGYGKKDVKSEFGTIELNPPRDRQGTFSPEVVKKRQRDISGIEDKVISMYAKGMSTRDISDHIHDIYGFELSAESISAITDKVIEKAKEWQSRPLEPLYALVFLDSMVVKLRVDGIVKNVTVYIIIGIDIHGNKSCLGLYVAESESSKYWLTVMNELKNRGVEDILIFSVDNLNGISEAITTAFPRAEIQKCIVHQIRNSLRFVPWKDRKIVAADLKTIYSASTEEQALTKLAAFRDKWDKTYPHISKSWEKNWGELSTYFKYSKYSRKLMYTTNPIESFNSSVRKVIKTRSVFPTQDALVKLFYLSMLDIQKRWTQILRDWGYIYAELTIFFGERVEKYD